MKKMLQFQIKRARECYERAKHGVGLLSDRRCRFVVCLMKDIYAAILRAIEQNNFNVFIRRAHVDSIDKILLALTTIFRGEYL